MYANRRAPDRPRRRAKGPLVGCLCWIAVASLPVGIPAHEAAAQLLGPSDEDRAPVGPAIPAGPERDRRLERIDRAMVEGAERVRREEARRMAPFDLTWGLP